MFRFKLHHTVHQPAVRFGSDFDPNRLDMWFECSVPIIHDEELRKVALDCFIRQMQDLFGDAADSFRCLESDEWWDDSATDRENAEHPDLYMATIPFNLNLIKKRKA